MNKVSAKVLEMSKSNEGKHSLLLEFENSQQVNLPISNELGSSGFGLSGKITLILEEESLVGEVASKSDEMKPSAEVMAMMNDEPAKKVSADKAK